MRVFPPDLMCAAQIDCFVCIVKHYGDNVNAIDLLPCVEKCRIIALKNKDIWEALDDCLLWRSPDRLPAPETGKDGATLYQPFNGGSVYNTAIALGRLGNRTGLFTGLSTDFFGDMLREGLKASKVDLRYIKTWDRPSTLAFVKLTDGHARYSFFDDNSAGRMLTTPRSAEAGESRCRPAFRLHQPDPRTRRRDTGGADEARGASPVSSPSIPISAPA